ncbi:serine hydrolase domain-containing protein, partial [Desulfobacterales bacterium HSG16]|nr:serine hydrolase domain-containing protein [Desulfobacterales bacterium HSG16]
MAMEKNMEFGNKIGETMKAGISAGVFPGSVLLVSEKGNIRFFRAYGQTDIYSGERVKLDTIFDLASLTKPLATTIAVILLIQEKKLRLDYCIGDLMPCFKDTDKAKITIRNLLLHDSGLPDYWPYYKRLQKIKFEDR